MLEELKNPHVAGVRQVRRALEAGRVKTLFTAQDADTALTAPLAQRAEELGVPVEGSCTMAQLGVACGLAVGAAVAATVR